MDEQKNKKRKKGEDGELEQAKTEREPKRSVCPDEPGSDDDSDGIIGAKKPQSGRWKNKKRKKEEDGELEEAKIERPEEVNSDDDSDGVVKLDSVATSDVFLLFEEIWRLQDEIESRLGAEDYLGASPYKKKKTQLLTKIGSIACCKICGIARPSKDARSHIAETWYRRLCGYCHSGRGVRGEDTVPSRLRALTSIRCRALAELEQALAVACGATIFKRVQLTRAITELRRLVTPKRLRQSGTPTVAVSLAGQLVRTQLLLRQHGSHQTQLDAIDTALSLIGFL